MRGKYSPQTAGQQPSEKKWMLVVLDTQELKKTIFSAFQNAQYGSFYE